MPSKTPIGWTEITFPSLEGIQDRIKDRTVKGVKPESILVTESELDELIADVRHHLVSGGWKDPDDWDDFKTKARVSGVRLVANDVG